MRFALREKPILKSAVYSIICLCLLLFSHSFFPALQISRNIPYLLIAAISMLAMLEGIKYASFFAAIFGITEAVMLGGSTLLLPLFYTAFAFASVWLFESFFTKNFFTWLCYTVGGLIIHAIISMFSPVANWDITAADLLLYTALPTLCMSLVFSLPLYPIFKFAKKATDKEN